MDLSEADEEIAALRADADELRADAPGGGDDPATVRYLEAYRLEVDRLKAENARLARERRDLLFREVYRCQEGWYVRGVWFAAQPFATREEAAARLVEHARRYWDWPSERRRRKEEGWPDEPE